MQSSATPMREIRTAKEMRLYREALDPSASIAFVPTMGALHEGHLSIVRAARENDICIVSIFVNAKQFADGEAFDRYPITRERDIHHLQALHVDALYLPREDEVYPDGYMTYVYPNVGHPNRNPRSEGAARPTFFRGVATVMLHLLATIRPHRLYLGQKDAQQCAVMREIVDDLWMDVTVVVLPTVRDFDGLAMSSCNVYLTSLERQYASVIFNAMRAAQELFDTGERQADRLRQAARNFIDQTWQHPTEVRLDVSYISICDKDTIVEVEGEVPADRQTLICIAGSMGHAQLIDCWELRVGGSATAHALTSGRSSNEPDNEEDTMVE